ncbi:DNA alkylation repair protein [Sodaliphilus sp.]|uniref:DNA alkylation repair protein n=1 Tax=Sodaliphilus sp. TaxID=2815818 RepID=UPI00388DC729
MLNDINSIKKEFFAFRNGIIADGLRNNGDPHQYIMGCQLVDVIAIASRVEHSAALAQELWNDSKHRECRMVASMLYPCEIMDYNTAHDWATSVESKEIADVLCHRLLRHLTFAEALGFDLVASSEYLVKYTGWRLILNLVLNGNIKNLPSVKDAVLKERVAQAQQDIMQLLDSISEEL